MAAPTKLAPAPVRPFWSGTITFGLVSIPVALVAGVRARQKSMKLVDADGHPLGRRYYCPKHEKVLKNDELVRGYETDSGKMVVVTDAEFESAAPEKSRDIQLERFVALDEIPPMYFERSYYLAPDERAGKAYALLAQTMAASGKAGIGSFVMRGSELLVAIVSDNGLLRAEVLRYADELRAPEAIGLPKPGKAKAGKEQAGLVRELGRAIDKLRADRLSLSEMEDLEAQELRKLAQRKANSGRGVIDMERLEDDEDGDYEGAEVIDLMKLLSKSLGAKAGPAKAPAKAGATRAAPARKAAGAKASGKKTTRRTPAKATAKAAARSARKAA